MSEDRPERPPTAQFLAALEVSRNAKLGLATGGAFAAVLYLFFVALAPATAESPVLYLGLAFVVAVSTAGIVTLVLTLRTAIRLSRDLEDDDLDGLDALEG